MKIRYGYLAILTAVVAVGCHMDKKKKENLNEPFKKGTFGYDLAFLNNKDSLVVLQSKDGQSKVIVSPKYQGKVFTSTAAGDNGKSFGWVNYKAFDSKVDPHMNAYGGEDRLWLGPEGSKFALFFKPGTKMEFASWHTPAAFDHEPWNLVSKSDEQITLAKDMSLQNYAGTNLKLKIDRSISLLDKDSIQKSLDIQLDSTVKAVGIRTDNSLTNTGTNKWTPQTGAPCLWNLDMFTPSPGVVIVIPYNENAAGKIATTDYFGQIPPDRVTMKNGHLFFKADGKSRGKLGMPALRTKGVAGSYDAINHVLTIATFEFDSKATYLNQEWRTDRDPLVGDAVNAYNDGPLADGTQMGPFYEIESVSPAAFLKPGKTLSHRHAIFHFTGNVSSLDKLAEKTLGVSLKDIQSAFNGTKQ
ncbi:MAG TPA: DUF6786 family protein [Mucilaginibacter sp.]|nr:DUF6786 family protein [Mucilaginibacter sp.]